MENRDTKFVIKRGVYDLFITCDSEHAQRKFLWEMMADPAYQFYGIEADPLQVILEGIELYIEKHGLENAIVRTVKDDCETIENSKEK